MPIAIKQWIFFLVIMVFYLLLFLLAIYIADYVPVDTFDPSGSHKVEQSLMAVCGAFLVTMVFMIGCHFWARKWAINMGWCWLANIVSIIMALFVLNALGFYL
ncbi:hypothetical protein [Entomomonas asaccharolytica]|uniref:Uncharacterized protein n=1 Tax=Entomomonas asaccharolytica TaxID=2785331 RepID=A0A974NDU8_9GAMM|nr:hypothetical protein [Entomomonas asaccharolytica]QQP84764.1 hypothetical protein JHT90_10145 [Entomomonas asaccharolytica]